MRQQDAMGRFTTTPLAARFEQYVERIPEHPCWEWTGARSHRGYGVTSIGRRSLRAHRAVWELYRGPIPKGAVVCHRCDNPGCVNPDHLFLGTTKQNNHDAARKGRTYQGPWPWAAKLCAQDVQLIRQLIAAGDGYRAVARRFGVTHENVRAIVARRTWKYVN